MCLLLKVKRPVRMRSIKKGFHEKLCASDRSGQPENLSENTRVEQTHDGSKQPDDCNKSTTHTMKERYAHEVHREIALFNTDNEFNRAINEENIDFNIPRLLHSAVKRLHSASVRELIQRIENHPQRPALQSDLQQHRAFNPFSKESKEIIHEVGNIELCELLIWNPKHSAKYACRTGTSASSTARAVYFLRKGTEENKKFIQYTMDLLSIPNYYIKNRRPHGHHHGKKPRDHEDYIANSLKKKCQKRNFLGIDDRFIRDEKFRKKHV